MPDGRVLIIGGSNGAIPSGGVIATAEMYDPATGIFTQTGSLRETRENHRAVLLDNDKVLVAGGDNGQAVLASAELYDSTSGAFITAGNMTTPRSQFMAELLSNGQVLVSGGLTGYVEGALSSTADLYTPAVP